MTDAAKYYVFYDGECGMCNYWLRWILRNDYRKQFLFSPLQSEFGQQFLKERNLEHREFNTLYLWKPNSFYDTKSRAIFRIAKILGGKFTLLGFFAFFPRIIIDFVYDRIAANRQRFLTNQCALPTEDERARFIER